MLAGSAVTGGGYDTEWIARLVAAGRVSWDQLLRHVHPARFVLGAEVSEHAGARHAALSALITECVGVPEVGSRAAAYGGRGGHIVADAGHLWNTR